MPQASVVEVEVRLRRSDLIRANLLSLLRPRFLLIQFGLVNALLLGFTMALSPDGVALLRDPYVWEVAVMVNLLLAAALAAQTWAASLRIWKRTPTLHHRTRYTITKERLTWENPLSRGETRLRNFQRIEDRAGLFLLYPEKHGVLILPYRAFGDPSQRDRFRALVQAAMRR